MPYLPKSGEGARLRLRFGFHGTDKQLRHRKVKEPTESHTAIRGRAAQWSQAVEDSRGRAWREAAASWSS